MSRYYPLQSLVSASGLSEAALARRVGLSGTTLKRAREVGLREDAADRYACRAGLTPLEVWPDWGHVDCAVDGCEVSFVPVRKGHRCCSERCSKILYKRTRYRSDPEFAESERQKRRTYYQECIEYERAASRARHQRDRDRKLAAMRAYYQANREELKAKQRARYRRGTSVEHPAGLISPGQSDVSDGASRVSRTDGGVAA